MTALGQVLDRMAGLDVLVVGDALLDDYLRGESTRMCREAPVPVVTVHSRSAQPGGAGNVAAGAAALGARVRLLTVVGDDADGRTLLAALVAAGVDVAGAVVDPGRTTVAKRRVVVGEQLVVRVDEGLPQEVHPPAAATVLARLPAMVAAADVVVVSDYGYGVLADEVVAALAGLQAADPRVVVVDARDLRRYRDLGATAVKPNADELADLLGGLPGPDRAAAVVRDCARLHALTGAHVVAGTLDRDGAVVCERGRPPYRTWTRAVAHSRACGAGDSFTTVLALALAAGADTPVAAELAQAAARVVTGREGTSTCSVEDLREDLAEATTRLEPAAALADRVAFHRRQGRRVVFTNGCFDLLHRGHVDLLNRAKALGDVLVVGLNTDAGMQALRGPDRPINRLEDRAQVLAALSCVDHLVAFDERTASALVALLRPDVFVKGGDYPADLVPERPAVEAYGGLVRILPYLEDRTTTALLERIRHGSGALAGERGR